MTLGQRIKVSFAPYKKNFEKVTISTSKASLVVTRH